MKKWLLVFFLTGMLYAQTGDWVAKIDNQIITKKEFAELYATQLDIMEVLSNYQADTSQIRNNKQYQEQFLEEYIANQLLLKKLREENKTKKFVNEQWLANLSQRIAKYVEEQVYFRKYLDVVLMPKVGPISDKEVEEVYNQNKEKFKEISASKAAEIIRERLKLQKAMVLFAKYREKVKGETSVKINDEAFK